MKPNEATPRICRRPGLRGPNPGSWLPLAALVAAVWTSGCVSHRVGPALAVSNGGQSDPAAVARARETLASLFPPRYRATQRAIITIGRKQFTCDGVLTAAPGEGHHLAVISSLGVVTDLRVDAHGACELLKVTPLFRESWSRQFVARDLRRLFVPPADLNYAGRLADGGVVLQTRADAAGVQARYVFTAAGDRWRELEISRNGRACYRLLVRRQRTFAGAPGERPCEFEIDAGRYRLELRIVELTIPPARPSEAGR
jgi:hypothetical protein